MTTDADIRAAWVALKGERPQSHPPNRTCMEIASPEQKAWDAGLAAFTLGFKSERELEAAPGGRAQSDCDTGGIAHAGAGMLGARDG